MATPTLEERIMNALGRSNSMTPENVAAANATTAAASGAAADDASSQSSADAPPDSDPGVETKSPDAASNSSVSRSAFASTGRTQSAGMSLSGSVEDSANDADADKSGRADAGGADAPAVEKRKTRSGAVYAAVPATGAAAPRTSRGRGAKRQSTNAAASTGGGGDAHSGKKEEADGAGGAAAGAGGAATTPAKPLGSVPHLGGAVAAAKYLEPRRVPDPDKAAHPECTFKPAITPYESGKAELSNKQRIESLYAGAKATKERLNAERMRAMEDESKKYTFTPKTNAPPANMHSAMPAPGTLYERALQSRAKVAKMREDMAKPADATFTPKINRSFTRGPPMRKPVADGDGDGGGGGDGAAGGGGDGAARDGGDAAASAAGAQGGGPKSRSRSRSRSVEVRNVRGEVIQPRYLDPRKPKARVEDPECTFKPQVNTKVPKGVKRGRSGGGGGGAAQRAPAFERLAADGQARALKHAAMKRAIEEQAMEGVTFAPKLSKASRDMARRRRKTEGGVPASERLHSAGRLAESEIEAKRSEIAKAQGITFKPKINRQRKRGKKKGARGAAGGREDLWSRLHKDTKVRADVVAKYAEERSKKEMEECSFRPNIGASAKRAPARPESESAQPVWARLYAENFSNRDLQKVREEIKKQRDMEGCTFQPSIGKAHGRRGDRNIWEELYRSGRDEGTIERLRAELDAELTFQPKVSHTGGGGGKGGGGGSGSGSDGDGGTGRADEHVPIWERLSAVDRRRLDEEREAQRQAMELKDCTFVPEVHATKAYLKRHETEPKSVFTRLIYGGKMGHVPAGDPGDDVDAGAGVDDVAASPAPEATGLSGGARRAERGDRPRRARKTAEEREAAKAAKFEALKAQMKGKYGL